MKKIFFFIIVILLLFIFSCKTTRKPIDKNIIYEELALKYFIDSIYLKEIYDFKNKTLFYDGLVSGYISFGKYSIPSFPEEKEFLINNSNIKVKDFYINIPKKIKQISFREFQKKNNDNNSFIKVRHYTKSKKKILVVINFTNKLEVTNTIYIILDFSGKILNWEGETLMFVAPPQ